MEDLERHVAASATKVSRWTRVGVVAQASEAADTPEQSRYKWSKVYRLFGASGESQQDEVFAAVNMYFLRNGASPYGKYRKSIVTASGLSAVSGEITKITGKLEGEIRQFLRGRLDDSYIFLKHNPAVLEDEELAAIAEGAGVPREYCYLLADWFGRDCVYFVGDEVDYYNKLRTSKIASAGAKRFAEASEDDRVIEKVPESKSFGGNNTQSHSFGNGGLY